jgi:hypothetical protein
MTIGLLHRIALSVDLDLATNSVDGARAALIRACVLDGDVFLDVLDATLKETSRASGSLAEVLERGNSVWTVRSDRKGLTTRVDPIASEMVRLASSPNDEASAELREAWNKAYGLETDPSDAWDHSIKAVEALLIPAVVGKMNKANLGSVLGELRDNSAHWKFVLGDASVAERTIRLIWPNPDRHAGGERRAPSIEEARAVVHLAVTIVQWARDGVFTKV